MLGGLQAKKGDEIIERFVTQQAARLLAYLALFPKTRHSREFLTDMIWPEVDPAVSRLRLNQVLATLRRQLGQLGSGPGNLLVSDRLSVRLDPSHYVTDVQEFETYIAQSRLEDALACYRGDLLPFIYDDWAVSERVRLSGRLATVLQALIRQSRDPEESIEFARRLIELDPLQEQSHVELIGLYGRVGRISPALDQYQRLQKALREIGQEPSEATRRLMRQIQSGQVAKSSPPPTPHLIEPPAPHNDVSRLPSRVAAFFGRESDIQEGMNLLKEHRLLTLLGTGGIGKTQLALEIGRRLESDYQEAIAFVPLANINQLSQVEETILQALDIPLGSQSSREKLLSALSRWPKSLLILDNFEHLVEAAPIVQDLLSNVSGLAVLVTSQTPLGVAGEQLKPIQSLPTAPEKTPLEEMTQFSGVQLFLERARSVKPDFALTPRNFESIQALCSRLEGIPLALELAAGWAPTMPPQQMLAQLDQRLDFLRTRRRDVPERHRSLRAAIEYGFARLDKSAQDTLLASSVFENGFTHDSISAVEPSLPITDALASLAERALVKTDESQATGSFRFEVLESIREFAQDLVQPALQSKLKSNHAVYFAALTENASQDRFGPRQREWLSLLAEDHENLLAAIAWLETDDPAAALKMTASLDWYWEAKGRLKLGVERLQQLLRIVEKTHPIYPHALNSLSWMLWNQGELEKAALQAREALSLAKDSQDLHAMQDANYNLGVVAFKTQDLTTAPRFLAEAKQLAEQENDLPGISRSILLLGNVDRIQERLADAKQRYEEALRLEQELGNAIRICHTLSNLGGIAVDEGSYDLAVGYYEQCVALSTTIGHRGHEGVFRYNLATALALLGRIQESLAAFRDAINCLLNAGREDVIFYVLRDIGRYAMSTSNSERRGWVWGVADGLGKRTGVHPADFALFQECETDAVGEVERTSPNYVAGRALGASLNKADAFRSVLDWLTSEGGLP